MCPGCPAVTVHADVSIPVASPPAQGRTRGPSNPRSCPPGAGKKRLSGCVPVAVYTCWSTRAAHSCPQEPGCLSFSEGATRAPADSTSLALRDGGARSDPQRVTAEDGVTTHSPVSEGGEPWTPQAALRGPLLTRCAQTQHTVATSVPWKLCLCWADGDLGCMTSCTSTVCPGSQGAWEGDECVICLHGGPRKALGSVVWVLVSRESLMELPALSRSPRNFSPALGPEEGRPCPVGLPHPCSWLAVPEASCCGQRMGRKERRAS